MRSRKWGTVVRRATNLSRAVEAALASKTVDPGYRPSDTLPGTTMADTSAVEAEERFMFLETSISPRAGSYALEDALTGTPGPHGTIGIVPLLGGIAYHDKDSRKNAASSSGFPDVPFIVGRTLYMVECKSEAEYPRGLQKVWLARLAECDTIVTVVLKPSGWQRFIRYVRERLALNNREDRAARLAAEQA
jgi:hypothetical protein